MRIVRAIISSPVVPRYEENQVQTSPFSAPRAAPGGVDFSGLNQGLKQTTGILGEIAGQERAKADRTAVLDSRNQLDKAETDILYNPQTGALNQKGKNAFGLPEPTLKSFDETVSTISGTLSSKEQKDAFTQLAAQRRVDVDRQLQRHVFGEMRTYSDEQNKASLASTLNNVAQFSADPARVQQEMQFGLAVIMSDTETHGQDGTYQKLRIDAWKSSVHETVLNKLMNENAVTVSDYLEANKADMLPADVTKMEKTLKPLATKQIGMDTALELAKNLGTTPLIDVLGMARERLKKNTDALNIAEVQLHQMEAERRDQVKQVKEQTAAPIYKIIADIQASGRAAKLSDIPKEQWTELIKNAPEEAGKIQDSLRREVQAEQDRTERKADREERRLDRKERELERKQNQVTADNLTTWGALKLDPETLKKTNLDAIYVQGKMNRTQYQDLIIDQLAIKQGKGEHEARVLSNKQAVDTVLHSVGIISDPKDKDASDKYMKFYEKLNGRMKSFEIETGAKPKQEDVVRMSRGLLAEVSQDRAFWNKTVHVFESDPAKVIVPKADRTAITNALKKSGRPVTEDTIRSLYLEKQTRGK